MVFRRWILPLLLLSLGINLGLLFSLVARPWRSDPVDNEARREARREMAQRTPGGPPFDGPEKRSSDQHLVELARRLGLDEATRQPFIERQRSFFLRTEELRRERERTRRELHRALMEPEPDRAVVDRWLEELGRTTSAMERALAEHVLDARELLDGQAEERYLRFLEHLTTRRDGPRSQNQGPRSQNQRERPRRRP